MKRLVLSAVVLSITSSTTIFAADKKLELSLLPGYVMPTGDIKDLIGGSFRTAIQGGYAVNENVTVGLEFGYDLPCPVKDSFVRAALAAEGLTLDQNDSVINSYEASAFVKYSFGESGIKPYAHLGLGFYHSKSDIDLTVVEYPGVSITESDKDDDWGMSAGVGVRKDFNENVFGALDLRYHRIFDEDNNGFFIPSLAIGFKF